MSKWFVCYSSQWLRELPWENRTFFLITDRRDFGSILKRRIWRGYMQLDEQPKIVWKDFWWTQDWDENMVKNTKKGIFSISFARNLFLGNSFLIQLFWFHIEYKLQRRIRGLLKKVEQGLFLWSFWEKLKESLERYRNSFKVKCFFSEWL